MSSPEEQNKIENNETPKIIPENIEEKEISPEEFLEATNIEEQKFKQETTDETSKLNSVNIDEPTFEKIKSEDKVEENLSDINKEATEIINEARKEVSEEKAENTKDIFVLAKAETGQINIRPEDRNSEGKLLVFPGGPESNLSEENWKLVRTELFKKWFGNSDIKDENGEPALVYHTTDENLNNFEVFSDDKANIKREEKNKKAGTNMVETGFYFTAGKYEYGKNRLSVFVNAKVKEVERHGDIMNLKNEESLKLQKKGYTGLVHTFNHTENEINDLKKEYRRNYAPKSITDKIFYGFNKLLNTGNYIDALAKKLTEKKPIDSRDKILARNDLQDIKHETRKLMEIKKDAKSPFFEVCVLKSDQAMIVDKEEDYKNKIG